MLGRFFLIALLLVGAAAVALFATRSGYFVWRADDAGGATCHYWLGLGMGQARHDIADEAERARFECPVLVRDVTF